MSLPDPGQFIPGYQIDISYVDENGVTQEVRAFANTINWIRVDNGAVIEDPEDPQDPATAPVNVTAPGITGATLVGFILTANRGTWTGNPAPAFTYEWLADDVPIAGAFDTTYLLTVNELGKAIKVRVTATNSLGSVSLDSLATAPITQEQPPVAPSNTSAPFITGAAIVGQTLTADPGIWTGHPDPTFTYQWKADGFDIPTATNATLLLTADQLGQAITVQVTATNDAGIGTATSPATAPVEPEDTQVPGVPTNTVAPTISGTAQIGASLSVNQGTWDGNPAPTLSNQWFADGFKIEGATGSTYSLTENDRYKAITCVVTGKNSVGQASVTSNASPLVTGATAAGKRYIRRLATGLGDGSSWDNAAGLASLDSMIQAVGANGQILLRADEGTYSAALTNVAESGPDGAPVIIRGADVNEAPMNAVILGDRSEPWISNGSNTTGPEVFRFQDGVANLKFRNIEFRRCGNGCFRIGGNVDNLTIEQCAADNVMRFIENTVTGTAVTANLTNARIGHCTVRGFSRAFARLRYDGSDILMHDCFGDSEQQDGDNFASGVTLDDTVHDMTFERVTMINSLDTKDGNQTLYWNGDGFTQEAGNFNISYVDCRAKGNSDGGFDCKGTATLLRCIAEENKKNFRAWGTATLTRCISKDPFLRGGNSEASHISLHSAEVDMTLVDCAIVDKRPDTVVFLLDEAGAVLNVTNTSVQRDPASTLLKNDNGGTANLDTETAPAATAAPQLTGNQTVGQTLTCSPGTWDDGAAAISFQWCRNGLYIDGATGNTYVITGDDVAQVLTCRVFATASPSGFVGEAVSNATGSIQSVAPANVTPPTIVGLRAVGSTLTADPGTWTGSPSPSFTYQWHNNGVDIEGAVDSSYLLAAGDEGDAISVTVTGANSAGSDSATSAPTDPIAAAATELFVRNAVHGSGDGSSWDNAIGFGSLISAMGSLGPGAIVYIRADEGPYSPVDTKNIAKGGAPGNPITIKGVDVNLNDMKAHFIGTRTNWTPPADPEQVTNVSGWNDGNTLFSLKAGADHIVFRNLFTQNWEKGFDVNSAPVDDILIEDWEALNHRHGFYTLNHPITNVVIRRFKITGFSKDAVRIHDECNTWLIEDFWINSARQDRDNFAMAIKIDEVAHHITIRGHVPGGQYPGIIENCSDTEGSGYWNGDGIAAEKPNHDITVENVITRGHTDGGIDMKSTNTTLINVESYDNKRNYRLWGDTGMVLDGCTSRDPRKRGGSGGITHTHIVTDDVRTGPGLDITIKNSTFESTTGASQGSFSLIDGNIYNCILRALNNTFIGGPNDNDLPGNSLKLVGDVSDVTPPTIATGDAHNINNNTVFSIALTADKPVSWRISGGADQGIFSIVDDQGVANIVGDTLVMQKQTFTGVDDTREVIVEAKDANGNTNTKTITITILAADPTPTFETFFEGANGQTTDIVDSAGGKTISFVNGAQISTTDPLEGTSSLLLDDDDQLASTPDHEDFRITGEFSIKALIRPTALPSNINAIFGHFRDTNSQRSFRFNVTGLGALHFVYSTNGQQTIQGPMSAEGLIELNTTYEVAVDRDENNVIRLYIDGAMVASGVHTQAFFNSNAAVWIGNAGAQGHGFVGRIDALQFWNGWAFCGSDAGYTP